MPSISGSVTGWRVRASKRWYPTDGTWKDTSEKHSVNGNASSPVYDDGSQSSSNKYTVCIRVATPTNSAIETINSITISFYSYANDSTSASGTMYGSLRTVDPATGSTEDDTLATYRTYVAGGSSEVGISVSTTRTQYSMTFNGTFAQGTTYYLYLYSKSTGHIYRVAPHDSYFTCSCSYTQATPKYTVSYNSNGGSGSMSATSVNQGSAMTLPACSFTAPSGVLYNTVLDGNGGNNGSPTIGANAFYRWRLNSTSGTLYNAGDSYTPTANTTFYVQWYTPTSLGVTTRANSTANGYTVTFDANGGSCDTTSLTATNTISWSFNHWNSSQDGSGAKYTDTSATYIMTSTKTLYAMWDSSIASYGSITLPTPTRSGHAFKGWSTSSSASSGSTGSYTPSSNITLYATWEANSWTVSYNANGYGTAPSAQTKIQGQTLTLQPFIANQSITGYTVSFNGNGGNGATAITSTITKSQTYWNTAANGSGTNYGSNGSYTVDAGATLYAIWGGSTNNAITLPAAPTRSSSTASYTISYNANGGTSTPSSQSITRTTPYTFRYWTTAEIGGTQYAASSSYTPTSNTTLYAQWKAGTTTGTVTLQSGISKSNTTANGYTVTFDANGGSCSTTSLTATNTISWSFNCWNTNSSGTGTDYSSSMAYGFNSNTTLYAKFTSSIYSYGSITLPTPSRTGYTFKGWSTSSSATSGSTGSYTPSSNVTLYATWQINTWTVSYNANGHGTAPSSQTKTYNTNLTLRSFISNQSATGYTVSYNANGGSSTPSSSTSTITYSQAYWNTNSSGTGTNYSSGGTYTDNAAVTLYAIWKSTNGSVTLANAISRSSSSTNYTIKYNANGGNSTPSDQTLTRSTPYNFSGWRAGSTSGTLYSAGASYTPSSNITMYAYWTTGTTTGSVTLASSISKSSITENGYTVTLSDDGGTYDGTSLISSNIRSYTFKEWNTNSSGTGTSYSAGVSYSSDANLTLYAIFNNNISERLPVSLPTPKKTGYIFLGWSTTKGSTNYVSQDYIPTENVTLYANYKQGYEIEMYLFNNGKWLNVLMS